jgi:uncharacterized protein with ParB-like and HNH nuclease domain
MLKKIGVSLLGAMMLSSVALACDHSSIDDEDFLCDFLLVDDGANKQVSKQEERKVIKFDKEVVKKVMIDDGSYKEESFESEINALSQTDIRLQSVLDVYIADRTISDSFNIEGLTTKIVMEKWHCKFWDALSLMDTYIDNHERAKEVLAMQPVRWRD